MSEEMRNATCQKCGQRILVEDGVAEPCACDPECKLCHARFKKWKLDGYEKDEICLDCFDEGIEQFRREYRFVFRFLNLREFEHPCSYTADWERGFLQALKAAYDILELDIYHKLNREP